MCQETVFWAWLRQKCFNFRGTTSPWPPTRALHWTRWFHDFHAFIIWLTSTSTGYSRRYIITTMAIRARRGHDAMGYSRRYIITTRQSVWRGGYDAIGYRPGCFSEIAGIPAVTKLGDFPAKDFKKYSRWPRGTVDGCQGRLPAYHRASSKEII